VIVWRVRGKTIRSVLCNIVCNNCAHCNAHTYVCLLRLWACVYGLNERGYFVYFQPFIRSGDCVQLYQMRSPEVRITLVFILRVPTFITGRFSK